MSARNANVSQSGATPDQDLDAEEGDRETDQGADAQQRNADAEELSLDVVFEILKNERRRSVLRYLQSHEDRVVLGELAEHIAARENDTTVESLTAQQRKRVYVGLYQCHLPKMDDAGIVEFDRNRGIVELADNAEQLDEYLDTGADADHPWPTYYLGIAVAGAALFFAGQIGVLPFGWVADLVIVGVLAAVVCCATVHDRLTDDE
jgi:hypothetical protein